MTYTIFFHTVKSVLIRSYSDPHFLAFRLNTERYDGVSLSIHSECGKMWTRITPNRDTFYSVPVLHFDTLENTKKPKVSDVFGAYENVTLDEEELNYQVKTDNTSISVFVKLSWEGKDRK